MSEERQRFWGRALARASAATAEQLLAELSENAVRGRGLRIRLAVTATEYQLIRAHCLARDGRFYARVWNIPLVIEEDANRPTFYMEVASEEAAEDG
jgi:hypothetical protein